MNAILQDVTRVTLQDVTPVTCVDSGDPIDRLWLRYHLDARR